MPPYPYLVTISVYNEAGEVVRQMEVMRASGPVKSVEYYTVVNGEIIQNPPSFAAGDPYAIHLPGIETPDSAGLGGTSIMWDAKNSQGQEVRQGVYYIKVESKDQYGHVSAFINEVTVFRVEEYVELNIFNSAGEIVRSIRQYKSPVSEKLSLKVSELLIINKDGSSIAIEYNQGEHIMWDGKNSRGRTVTSGTYEIQIVAHTSQGSRIEASKTVIVLNEGKKYMSDIVIAPNPVKRETGKPEMVRLIWTTETAETGTMNIRIYNVAGELVSIINTTLESGEAAWNLRSRGGRKASAGPYVVVFEARNSEGYVERKMEKMGLAGSK